MYADPKINVHIHIRIHPSIYASMHANSLSPSLPLSLYIYKLQKCRGGGMTTYPYIYMNICMYIYNIYNT